MDFRPDPDLVAFRQTVREFLASPVARPFARRNPSVFHATREEVAGWTRLLYEQGWSAPNWPADYGGPGWSPLEQSIFMEECYLANMPRTNVQGLQMVGPVIYTFGSVAQRDRYLEPILRGDEFWAQGFSEPEAGSDLARLRTRAVRDGDSYVVNGQKIWTSSAQDADAIFCLVRTSEEEPPQAGISFLLIPRDTPGLTVRPILSMDNAYGLNEVFLDDAVVPAANLVGEENRGWEYAKFLLQNERTGGAADIPYCKKALGRIKRALPGERHDGSRGVEDGALGAQVVQLEAELLALDMSLNRLVGRQAEAPGLASMVKVRGSELQQSLSALLLELLGPAGAISHFDWQQGHESEADVEDGRGVANDFFYRRAATMWGGTNEVQRNILAKTLLSG